MEPMPDPKSSQSSILSDHGQTKLLPEGNLNKMEGIIEVLRLSDQWSYQLGSFLNEIKGVVQVFMGGRITSHTSKGFLTLNSTRAK